MRAPRAPRQRIAQLRPGRDTTGRSICHRFQKGTMNDFIRRAPWAQSLTLPLVLALSACGGGGDSAPASGGLSTPPAATALKIGGTAAVGAPMAQAAIAIACATGTASATADANGVYTVSI